MIAHDASPCRPRWCILYAELDTLFEDYDLDHVLGEVSGLAWFATHVGGLQLAGEHLVWVTGWTDDLRGHRLADALDHARTHALLRFRPPPAGMRPPQVLDNPPWMRPFELFARAFGVPGSDEADPTPVVAVIVPLLFGYMFGDLGQGAVLLGLGWWFARHGLELARMLILCGAAAMSFGLLFGSLFGMEDLIPALWLHPLQEPITRAGGPPGLRRRPALARPTARRAGGAAARRTGALAAARPGFSGHVSGPGEPALHHRHSAGSPRSGRSGICSARFWCSAT